ncbi:hypothetical protein AB1Y20_008646 [Prymnesium parvum]|uniref:Bifunctional lysine-specific demethylase and histidyl-hydroxylase n=1 Tax=Prymnesium parvum TaxID=97485 RepID=A0AB34IR34_PRYPA
MAPPLDLADFVEPLGVDEFLRSCWGSRTFLGAVRPAVLERLRRGFHHGQLEPVLAACRRADNSSFSAEEVQEMQTQLDSGRKTLNLPYCFCDGALDLAAAFLARGWQLANDVEVGVYFSEVGGDVAAWHQDNNHNLTVQLYGQKEWRCADGTVDADRSCAMFDAPRNRAEQTAPPPPAAAVAQGASYALAEGSVLAAASPSTCAWAT